MRHLTPDQLVDAAEAATPESVFPHLRSCERCRAELAELRGVLASLEVEAVPEPSPLFWPHLSARIHSAVEEEAQRSLHDRAAWSPSRLRLLASAAAFATLLVVAATLRVGDRTREPAGAPASPGLEVDTIVSPDDASLGFVADLSATLDWDAAHDAGIVAHTGLIDRAVGELSADERVELRRLLEEELRGE